MIKIFFNPLFDHRVALMELPCLILMASLCIGNNVSFRSIRIINHSGVLLWSQIATVKDCSHYVWSDFLDV